MNDITAFTKLDFAYIFVSICIILTCFKTVCTLVEWAAKKLGLEFAWIRKRNEDHELLIATVNNLKALQEKHEKDEDELQKCVESFITETRKENDELRNEMRKFAENRVHDREQSRNIQKELVDSQNANSQEISHLASEINMMKTEINERFTASEEKENKRVQAEIKDRIAQYYRHYNTEKKISAMELEGLEDLISTYESYGGENSFVHSVVQKEMYTWEVI